MCKKKIEEYSAESATLLSERQALEKMMDVYSQNHALGDPNSIKEQLEVNAKSLDKSNEELHKYQVCMSSFIFTIRKKTMSNKLMASAHNHF